ncbi:kelch repeat protein [Rutstroemia sp. NJR-2017a BBW]|nr:kelch repeat protein [Rutstroemia sp. NJR-2017a BBW]
MILARLLLLVPALLPLCSAQATWEPGQINTTMCYWTSPRAAVVRDTLYLDGGELWWEPGLNNGAYGVPIDDVSDNMSNIFTHISKAPNGQAANNIAPTYLDGAMLANDYGWYTYGGLATRTDAYSGQDKDAAKSYQIYESGPPKDFQSGFLDIKLPTNLTRYVVYGGAVSVPSENLGYYFAGLRSSNFSAIDDNKDPKKPYYNADTPSSTLISVNMADANNPKWANDTLPSAVPGRASPEIAWVPVSEQGALIAIGGVIDPSYASLNFANNASANAESARVSPSFMTTVSVYDVANKVWYEQETSGDPPGALNQGCSVVASAEDMSSHNIYWYGGYNGIHPDQTFSDDVYVLSIPSFIWTRVYAGSSTHGRAGHRCAKPYPDQMIIVGGYSSLAGSSPSCVENGLVQIFNLSNPAFLNSYDPAVWNNYTVPTAVQKSIGGSGTGSATQTQPSGGFSNSSMEALFGSSYNASKITHWYPYSKANTASPTSRPTLLPSAVAKKSGTPSYLAPVLGVVLGLFFLTLLILAFILFRRRRWLGFGSRTATHSESGTANEANRRTWNWIRGTSTHPPPNEAKAPTVTTDESELPVNSEPETVSEMASVPLYEMDASSPMPELHGTPQSRGAHPNMGFVPLNHTTRSYTNASRPSIAHSPSTASQASSVSGTSEPRLSPTSPASPGRADSVTINDTATRKRVTSDLSSVAESDRSHFRQNSNTSVSIDEDYGVTPPEVGTPGQRSDIISPLTPPQDAIDGPDYLTAHGTHVPPATAPDTRRRSNFAEKLDE